jgi:hypothetical protein
VISIWLVGRTLDATHSYAPVFAGLGLLMPAACAAGFSIIGRVQRMELRAQGVGALRYLRM